MRPCAVRIVICTLTTVLASLSGCVPFLPTDDPTRVLLGSANELASPAVPAMKYAPRAEDFAADHPEAPGLQLSFNTLHIIFVQSATIRDVNTLLRRLDAEIVGGVPGTAELEGILQIRVPTANHSELLPIYESLRNNPIVKVVAPDIVLTPQSVPAGNGGDPAAWKWESAPAGGNWGLELCRVPQMWNLNAALRKLGRATTTGVMDAGFDASHPDLRVAEFITPTEGNPLVHTPIGIAHGTHVAGTVAARFDNGVGVDGVDPYAELVVKRSNGLFDFMEIEAAYPNVRVINISMGMALVASGLDPNGAFVNGFMDAYGAIIAARIALAGEANLPTLVVAAGNESGGSSGAVNAAVSSQFANAALVHGAGNIIVVENVAQCDPCPGGAVRAASSCIGGIVSAPGVGILSTTSGSSYVTASGTSMASPLVAGVVSYLYAVEPSLTHAQVKELLTANAVPVDDGSARVDAWASAMDIDRITGGTQVLRMLLDIDDGTLDGNTRVEHGTPGDFTDEDADRDSEIGDGRIDMSDFRRWRDWLLQTEGPGNLDLDGSADHPKRDVNDNGAVESAGDENIYPRGDFNGDGRLSRTARSRVPGAIAVSTIDASKTDLEVLKAIFDDPHYAHGELDGLIESADIEVDPFECLSAPDVAFIRTTVKDIDGATVATNIHTPEARRRIFTLPVSNPTYTLEMVAGDLVGQTLFTDETEIDVNLGGDYFWEPDACGEFRIEITLAETIAPGSTTPLLVRIGIQRDDGSTRYLPDITIDLQVTAGSAAESTGETDADGFFSTDILVNDPYEVLTVFVTATTPTGREVTETATRFADGQGPIRVLAKTSALRAQVRSDPSVYFQVDEVCGSGHRPCDDDDPITTDFRPFDETAQVSRAGEASTRVRQVSELDFNPDGTFAGGRFQMEAETSVTAPSIAEHSTGGLGVNECIIQFEIANGSSYRFTINGSMSGNGIHIDGAYSITRSGFEDVIAISTSTGSPSDFAFINRQHVLEPGQYFLRLDLRILADAREGVRDSDSGSARLDAVFTLQRVE